MGCNCGTNSAPAQATYVVTLPSGQRATYQTEVEAAAAAQRQGGTYKAQ